MYSLIYKKHIYFEPIFKRFVFKRGKQMKQMDRHLTTTRETTNELDLNERIYSYLYISPRFAHIIYNVLQPKYDLMHFNRTIDSINQIKHNFSRRGLCLEEDLNQMVADLKHLVQLKTILEPKVEMKYKLKQKMTTKKRKNEDIPEEVSQQYQHICDDIRGLNETVYDLEEMVMPFVLNVPNDISDDTKHEVQVIDNYEPNAENRQKLSKYLNYIQLSYINKCLYKSIVGPKSCYLMGISAQLNDSLIEYLSQNLRQNQFIDISGIDFVKTAVIEATHYHDLLDYKSDKLHIKAKQNQSLNEVLNQSLHFAGNSSLESICAVISKRLFKWTDSQIKLLSIGQQFEQNLSQNNSLNAMIITRDDIVLSDNQMNTLYQLLWKCFTDLDLKCRAIRSSVDQLERSQYSGIDIEVWHQSENQWTTVSQITHYKDYISRRLGAPDSHLINASIHLLPIIIAIIEQNQTIDADIEIPICLKQFII